MARHISVGIDIGSHNVKVAIAEEFKVGDKLTHKIIGTGTAETRGLDKGFVVNKEEVARSVRIATNKAEKASGVEVRRAFISVGGVGLSSVMTNGSVAISRADLEVTNLDVEGAHESAERAIPKNQSLNRKIINTIPIETKLDGRVVLGDVEGMHGGQLEVRMLFITCLENHLDNLIRSVEEAGIEVVDVVAAPIASSFVILSKKQKRAGCLLLNVGSETTSLIIFENSNPLSVEVFEMGGADLTNSIALGLKTNLEEAESIKLGSLTRTEYSKKKFDDIINKSLGQMFELVDDHLKKIGRQRLLPAGVILTGGGSALYGMREFAEEALSLPASVGTIHFGEEEKNSNKDLPWSTALGLVVFGFNSEGEQGALGQQGLGKLAQGGKNGLKNLSHWIAKFLP